MRRYCLVLVATLSLGVVGACSTATPETTRDEHIARGDKPVVKLVPIPTASAPKRQPGRLKGKIALDDAFWEPLSEEELELWGMK